MSPYSAKVKTPFAVLGIRTANGMVTRIQYLPTSERSQAPTDRVAERAVREVERYLADPNFRFSLPLASTGTPFRRRVWQSITGIPVGESRTYGELARALHTAPRAVGGACAANEIALVIPCHRVVGSHGSLGGFMSAKGRPERELLPLGGTARSAKGAPICAKGRPERELLPLVATARSAKGAPICAKGRPERELLPLGGTARSAESAPVNAVDGDPLAIKRWLLKHEGYRFGA